MKSKIKNSIIFVSLVSLFIPILMSQLENPQACDSPVNRDDIKYTSPKR